MPDQMNLASPTEVIQQISQILQTLPAEKLTEVQDYLLFLQSTHHQPPQLNDNGIGHRQEQNQYDILLTKEPTNGYMARPLLMPELVVSGQNESEALALVGQAIASRIAESRIVRITVPSGEQTASNPWLRFAGEWGTEDEWAHFQANIATFRQELDRQEE